MKKILTFTLLLISLFVLGACNFPVPGGNNDNNNADPVALAAPVVTVDESGLASWEAVEHASGYIYKIGNGADKLTTKTSVQLVAGESIVVKAKGDGKNYTDSEFSASVTYTVEEVPATVVGLPTPAAGYYMRDAEIIQDGDVRYLIYTTNKTVAEDDNVIAIRKADLTEEGWVYGAEVVVLEPSADGWDKYLGSASVVKGEFALNGETYNYLMAYQGTTQSSGSASSIGLAVAKEIQGEWVKVGTAPVIAFDAKEHGLNMAGCYAPSVVNYTKVSGIRIFYSYADKYGHFAYFWDADLSDLSNIKGVKALITNEGGLSDGGAGGVMFPNADFAYDSVNCVFYTVKDYSPAAASKPSFAERFELAHIAEEELYTTDKGLGWVSDVLMDNFDLELDLEYERVYSACIVSDAYGHMLEGNIEIVYNTCMAGDDYLYTQKFLTYIHE